MGILKICAAMPLCVDRFPAKLPFTVIVATMIGDMHQVK